MCDSERELIKALEAAGFESAKDIATEYGASVIRALQAAPDQQSRETTFKSAIATLNHALRIARVGRSHVACRLAALQKESAYQIRSMTSSGWFLDC